MSHNDLPQVSPEFWDVRSMTRRSIMRRAGGVMVTAQIAGMLLVGTLGAQENVKENVDSKPADSGQKTVYISFLLHGNMCYDRYTKQEIREKFPGIYATGVRAMHKNPDVTAHIDFPGLTVLSLKRYAPWFLDELKPLVDRKQVVMVGCEYAANHPMCADEESELLAGRVTMEIIRRDWPSEQSLLNITPASARVTAFRSDRDGNSIVANDAAGEPCRFECQGQSVAMPAFGSVTVRVSP